VNLHFISGLPRSGSTLLAAILRQNPRFHAGMTSPVGSILLAMLSAVSRKNETAVFIDPKQKRDLCAGVFENYYRDNPRPVIFDTNRLWCAKLPLIADLFRESKVICCVRDVSWIMDSIEKLYRANIFDLSGVFGFEAGGTVYSRVNQLATSNGMVGYALDALREGYYGEHRHKLLLVDYDDLTKDPTGAVARIYSFLGEKPFVHDFSNVEYEAMDFDLALGTPGLHTVRKKVEHIERPTILPPHLFQRFQEDAFWKAEEKRRGRFHFLRQT